VKQFEGQSYLLTPIDPPLLFQQIGDRFIADFATSSYELESLTTAPQWNQKAFKSIDL
jgi:hypothetical protein